MARRWIHSLLLLLTALFILLGCESDNGRKIKLASFDSSPQNVSQTASSVLQVAPEQQRSIAILYFENETGDPSLDWLNRGLTDMLVTKLSHSPYLNVITMQRLGEVARQNGKTDGDLNNVSVAANIAWEAKAEIIVSGQFYQLNDSLCIEVQIIDAFSAKLIRRETVRGESLERIFAMVDSLSDRVRSNVRDDYEEFKSNGVALAEMTHSVEAFRCYSLALDNMEKLLKFETEKSLEDAIKYDSTFAAAYLKLAFIKFEYGKTEEGERLLQKALEYTGKLSEADQVHLKLFEARRNERHDMLIPILEEGVASLPSDIDLRLQLARYYRGFGDLDRSLEQFEIALEQDPNRKLIYNDLGYLFAERGDFTAALKYLDIYRQLAPDEPNPYDSKGEILMKAGRLDEAKTQLQIALDKWPAFFHSALRLAAISAESGDYKRALAYVDQATQSVENDKIEFGSNFQRALILWRSGQIKEAGRVFDSMLEAHPNSAYIVATAAEMCKSVGDTAQAQQLFSSAFNNLKEQLEREKENFKKFHSFGDIALMAQLPASQTIPALEKLRDYQTNPRLQAIGDFILGLAYFRAGENQKAEACFQKSSQEQFNQLALARYEGWENLWKHVFEVLDYESRHTPEEERFYQRFSDFVKDKGREDLQVISRFARAHFYGNSDDKTALEAEYRFLGAPLESTWRLVGPFSMKGVSGFNHPYPPEKEIDLSATYRSDNREIQWHAAADGSYDGYVDVRAILKRSDWSVGYGLIYIKSPEKRKVQIRLGCNDGYKLWFNNKLILQRFQHGDAIVDRDLVTVLLHPGYNQLLLKTTSAAHDWGYYLRVTDENGNGFEDITFHSPDELEQPFAQW